MLVPSVRSSRRGLALSLLVLMPALVVPATVAAPSGVDTAALLTAGRLSDARQQLDRRLAAAPENDQLRFEAGIVRMLSGVEELGQALYRYGPRTRPLGLVGIPGTRLPLPENADPEQISYVKLRGVLEDWCVALRETEALLAPLSDADVKLTLPFGLVRLDLNGDGEATDDESLWRIYAALNRGADLTEKNVGEFTIAFDRADAAWLQAYCHTLLGVTEFLLAHDFRELFERTGHLIFPKVDTPHRYLSEVGSGLNQTMFEQIADLVAYIHLLSFDVADPARLQRSHAHFRSVLRISGQMWRFAEAETDDDREWIPNPNQTGVIANVAVTREQVAAWREFLDEADALLTGEKLLPFWRDADGRGVNLARVFTDPRRFDLVLWVQGSAATPYLEAGTVTEAGFWQRLQRTFGGQFATFALWWN